MKEVIIKFDGFVLVLQYIITRLRNHSMLIKSEHTPKGMMLARMIGVPQFKIFTSDLNVKAEEIKYVLEFLTGFNNDKASPHGIMHYVQVSDGYVATLKEMGNASFVQNVYDNILLLKQDAQTDLMNDISAAKLDHSIFNEATGVLVMMFEVKQEFPMIMNNKDKYYEKTEADSTNKKEGNNELTRREASSNGGLSSYDGNRKLQPIVNELVIKFCHNKAYHEKNKFYEDIYDTLVKDHLDLLKEYSAYKRYLKDENVDWQRTIYDWCRACMKKNKITYTIIKRIKPKYRRIT